MNRPSWEVWRNRAARFLAGAGTTLITAAGGLLRNKWLAVHLDAAGVGIVSQIMAGQSWLGALVGMGLGLPVSRAVGAAAAAGRPEAARRSVWTGMSLVALASAPVLAAGIVFAETISTLLLGDPAHAALIRVSMLGALGIGVFQIVQAAAAGRSDVRAPIWFAAGGVGIATALTFALVPRFGLLGAVLASALLFPAGVVFLVSAHRRRHPEAFTPRPRPPLDRSEARGLLSVSGAALLLPLADQGTLLALRAHFLREHGLAANGLLQAALAMSQQVGALFYAYLASYAFGKISGAGGREGIEAYTRRHWTALIALAAAACAAAMVLASPLLHLLYSSRFDPARTMMAFAIFGEFGRIGLQTVALGSLPLGGVRLWARIGLVQPAALAASYGVLTSAGAGSLSLPMAYAAGGAATFAAGAWMMAGAGMRLHARGLAFAAIAYAALGAVLLAVVR